MKLHFEDGAYMRLEIEGRIRQASFVSENWEDDEGFGESTERDTRKATLSSLNHQGHLLDEISDEISEDTVDKKRKKGLAYSLKKNTRNFGMGFVSIFKFRGIWKRWRKIRKHQSFEKLI